MDFVNDKQLQAEGFKGFVSIANLQATACKDVPKLPGVYLVLRTDQNPPVFLSQSIGGHLRGDPTVSITKLESKWVEPSSVIYIGKAGGESSRATLKQRLWQYMQFGMGKPIGHWGGRYIWQLTNANELIVCWKTTEDAEKVEEALIADFKRKYGKRPFANLMD